MVRTQLIDPCELVGRGAGQRWCAEEMLRRGTGWAIVEEGTGRCCRGRLAFTISSAGYADYREIAISCMVRVPSTVSQDQRASELLRVAEDSEAGSAEARRGDLLNTH